MVAWFAGLFYLVRLFVYHTEALSKDQAERDILTQQYHIMETRLYKIICNPAMMLTWVFGIWMIYINGLDWLKENNWLHVKIILVFFLTGYHTNNKKIIASLKEGTAKMSAFQFRLYNEVPTLFLVSIVLLAIYKNLLQFGYTFAGIIAFSIILFIFASVYRKIRIQNDK